MADSAGRRDDPVDSARRHFDRFGRSYDTGPLARLQRTVLAELNPRAGEAFLDVSCGSGAAVLAAARRGARAVGVDISPASIERARASARDVPGALFEVGDAQDLMFPDERFDAVMCTTAMHHYPDLDRAIAEMARVLRPGGRLAIADFVSNAPVIAGLDIVLRWTEVGHVGFLSTDDLVLAACATDLEAIRVRRLALGHYAVVTAVGKHPEDRTANRGIEHGGGEP